MAQLNSTSGHHAGLQGVGDDEAHIAYVKLAI